MQPKPQVILYTDGACKGNPGPGGWAFVLQHPQSGKTLERFGSVIAIACEITADGAPAPAVQSEHSGSDLNAYKDDWWKNPKVLDNPVLKRRDGLLLERSKTPFGLINIDDYEAVR